VLVISWGKGDPHKDAITLVYLDEAGRLRDHTKIDNLYDQDNLDEFLFLLDRRKPDVAVVGGFSIATLKLRQRVKEVLRGTAVPGPDGHGWGNNSKAFDIPVIYVQDDVARIYQHSKRATQEFSALSPIAKYCVGLARYVQSPLNEFAALGSDITAISFDEDNQNLVSKEVSYSIHSKRRDRFQRTNSSLHLNEFSSMLRTKLESKSIELLRIFIISNYSLTSVASDRERPKF
jgi:transcription elongation factor SPT6